MLPYKVIEIFTGEAVRFRHKPVVDAVCEYIRELKIAARVIVTRGIAGCYENGETASTRLEVLSFNLPVRIDIVIPAAEVAAVLDKLTGMVGDGLIALRDLPVITHRVRNAFFPRQLRVRDVMTATPRRVSAETSLSEAAKLLLSSIFTGLPVVDEASRPIGIITQGDLVNRGGLPLRLGLLAESDHRRAGGELERLSSRTVGETMTAPAITISDDRPLSDGVDMMLARGVKRLPVVDGAGRLVGMLSRLDIFKTVMRDAPDWNAFRAQKIEVGPIKTVGNILRRDTHTVSPDTPLLEVIRIIDDNDIQRVAVIDAAGKLLGLISDRELLRCFKQPTTDGGALFAKVRRSLKRGPAGDDLPSGIELTDAAAIMTTDLVTVREETLIEEAISLMTKTALKRLPVVDASGRFRGMISRDSLLRTGFAGKDSVHA